VESIGLLVKATGTGLFIKGERLTRCKQGSRMIKVVVERDATLIEGYPDAILFGVSLHVKAGPQNLNLRIFEFYNEGSIIHTNHIKIGFTL